MSKKYWINSNTGDFIIQIEDNKYKLILIDRIIEGKWLPSEVVTLTPSQFETIQGFVPIKQKKIKTSLRSGKYAPTLSNGEKGESYRVEVPTISQSRDDILKKMGIIL